MIIQIYLTVLLGAISIALGIVMGEQDKKRKLTWPQFIGSVIWLVLMIIGIIFIWLI